MSKVAPEPMTWIFDRLPLYWNSWPATTGMPTEAVGAVPSSRQRIVAPDTEISGMVAPAGTVRPVPAVIGAPVICWYPRGTHASMMIFGVVEPSGLGRELAMLQLGGSIREGRADPGYFGIEGITLCARIGDFLLQGGQGLTCGIDLALGVLDPALVLGLLGGKLCSGLLIDSRAFELAIADIGIGVRLDFIGGDPRFLNVFERSRHGLLGTLGTLLGRLRAFYGGKRIGQRLSEVVKG